MENINSRYEKTFAFLIYAALMVLALGVLTSTTLLAGFHILILIPSLYFLTKTNFKLLPKSAWALLALTLVLILSTIVNQDIAIKGYQPILKTKYFLIGFLSLMPVYWFLKNHMTEKKLSYLLYALCIATSIATVSGLCGIWFGFNPILMKATVVGGRYGGLFGMVMNYAHNMSYFLIIIIGLLLNRKSIEKFINIKFLIVVLLINLVGFYFSFTRGAWLALLAGIPFYYFKSHKKIFISFGIVFFLFGAIAYFVAGGNVKRPQSDRERISQWLAAIKAFEERPILGYGYLNFEPHSGKIKERYKLGSLKLVSHAHNNFFEMLGGSGAVGFVAFVAWIFLWFKEMYSSNEITSKIGLAFIIVFIVSGLTQSTITLGVNLFFIMAMWCVTVAIKWSKE